MKTLTLALWVPAFLAVVAQNDLSPKYVAEIYFVVDSQVLKNYRKLGYTKMTAEATLREDIRFFVYEANKYFSTMARYNLSLEIRMKKLDILKTDIFDKTELRKGKSIEGYVGLALFKEWLKRERALAKIDYDVAMLWTGFDLLSRSGRSSITGYATTKSACTREKGGVAMVEFDGTQSTAYTTAHELAHALGTSHDSKDNAKCPSFVGYVMTPSLKATNSRRWEFSECSVESIRTYIARMDRYRRNCLLRTTTPAVTFHVESQRGRDVLDAQQICARKRGDKDSYFCGFDGFYEGAPARGDLVCQYMYCAATGSRSCASATPTEGMMCDPGKRCSKGRCVPAPANFPTQEGLQPRCLYGDLLSGRVLGFSGTCEEFLSAKGLHQCYRYSINDECCASCAARKLNLPGCEYGDRFLECMMFTPSQICPNNRDECCFTCRHFRAKRSELDESEILPKLVRREEDDDELKEGEPWTIVD